MVKLRRCCQEHIVCLTIRQKKSAHHQGLSPDQDASDIVLEKTLTKKKTPYMQNEQVETSCQGIDRSRVKHKDQTVETSKVGGGRSKGDRTGSTQMYTKQ
jgi:hypothetical protein